MTDFVFRVTGLCNKRCGTCCCRDPRSVLLPESFRKKAREIFEFSDKRGESAVICFTGGEPFLYRAPDERGRRWDIVNLVTATRRWLPNALVVLKTSGWTPHKVLDRFLDAIESPVSDTTVDVRLGFNLYQNDGADAEDRLEHMIVSVLKYQRTMRIDTIYDLRNLSATLELFDRVLWRLGGPATRLADMMTAPERGWRFTIPVRFVPFKPNHHFGAERRILLDTMPAHPGLEGTPSKDFIEAEVGPSCPTIQSGPNVIMYEPDLSFHHCNDAFADYSFSAFSSSQIQCVDEQFAFLEERFALLKDHLKESNISFSHRRERCIYCTRFLHRLSTG